MRKYGFLVAAAALALAACNSSAPSGGGSAAPVAGADGKKLRIGVSIPAADHGWTAGLNSWAKTAMDLYPDVEWSFAAAETPTKQIADIETMTTKGLDGLVVLATESAPLTPVAEQVKAKGIFLVNVDRGFLKPVADVFLEGDNQAFGRKSAEFIVSKLGGRGDIVILEGIPSTVNTDRVGAAKAVFAANPGVRVLDSQSGMWNRQKSMEVMQTLLLKHKKIDAVWASDDDMLLGAEQAIKDAGRAKEMWLLGGGGMKEVVKRIQDGDPAIPATVTYPPSMIAMGIHTAVSALQGGRVDKIKPFLPKHLMLDIDLVTPENAKDYYFPDSKY